MHATAACRLMRDPTVVWCLLSPFYRIPANIRINCVLPKVKFLNYMTAPIVWVYMYSILRNCFRKPRKSVLDARRNRTVAFDASFLENPREYPHKLYIARNWSRCRWFALLKYVSTFINFHAIIFESRTVGIQANGRTKTEFNAK